MRPANNMARAVPAVPDQAVDRRMGLTADAHEGSRGPAFS
jgi:hypothetical protein